MKNIALLLILSLCLLSCKDQGEIPEYVQIVSVSPAPNERNVDKTRFVSVRLNRPVEPGTSGKISMRYVDDTSAVRNYPREGLTPPLIEFLTNGPFIWKPGRTVEVTIPKTIGDPEGRMMKEDFTFRFMIARDTIPFQLTVSQPHTGDTVSLAAFPYGYVSGTLTFNDYLTIRDSILTITPPAKIRFVVRTYIQVEERNSLEKIIRFVMENLSANSRYEITVPQQIKDYEGETLSQDYRIVFYTKP